MPGFNKKGPQNQGSMSGGKRGICISDTKETQEELPLGCGTGGKRVNGAGRCVGRGMGGGFNNTAGSGRGRGMREQSR